IEVRFDAGLTDGPPVTFEVENVDIAEAFNILALQTRTIVDVIDGSSIRVAAGGNSVLNNPQFQHDKTVVLHNTHSSTELSSIVNVTRQSLIIRDITPLPDTSSIE